MNEKEKSKEGNNPYETTDLESPLLLGYFSDSLPKYLTKFKGNLIECFTINVNTILNKFNQT